MISLTMIRTDQNNSSDWDRSGVLLIESTSLCFFVYGASLIDFNDLEVSKVFDGRMFDGRLSTQLSRSFSIWDAMFELCWGGEGDR